MSAGLINDFDYVTPVVVREWSRYPVTRSSNQEISSSKSGASRNEAVKRTNGKRKVQYSNTKILLELRKDRSSSRSTSSNDRSLISSDDEVESKKEIEIESTDDDDFQSYSEEIRKMATSITEETAPFEPSLLTAYDEIFVNFCMAEFTSEFSSTVIDTSEFFRLEAYKKVLEFVNKEKRIRKDEQEEQEIAAIIAKMVIRV